MFLVKSGVVKAVWGQMWVEDSMEAMNFFMKSNFTVNREAVTRMGCTVKDFSV